MFYSLASHPLTIKTSVGTGGPNQSLQGGIALLPATRRGICGEAHVPPAQALPLPGHLHHSGLAPSEGLPRRSPGLGVPFGAISGAPGRFSGNLNPLIRAFQEVARARQVLSDLAGCVVSSPRWLWATSPAACESPVGQA